LRVRHPAILSFQSNPSSSAAGKQIRLNTAAAPSMAAPVAFSIASATGLTPSKSVMTLDSFSAIGNFFRPFLGLHRFLVAVVSLAPVGGGQHPTCFGSPADGACT